MIKIVGSERQGERLYVTLEGDTVDEVNSNAARKLAYDYRFEKGFENAGIAAVGGSYPVDRAKIDEKTKMCSPVSHEKMAEISKRQKDLAYQHVYVLTRGI